MSRGCGLEISNAKRTWASGTTWTTKEKNGDADFDKRNGFFILHWDEGDIIPRGFYAGYIWVGMILGYIPPSPFIDIIYLFIFIVY